MVKRETSTTHQARSWDTCNRLATMKTSTAHKANSTPWNKSTRHKCASTSKKKVNVHFANTANSLTDQRSLESRLTHFQLNLEKLLSVPFIQTTRLSHANIWKNLVNASLEMAAPSITTRKKEEASLIHFQTFQKALLYHQCQRDNKITDQRTRITEAITTTIPSLSQATNYHHNQWFSSLA